MITLDTHEIRIGILFHNYRILAYNYLLYYYHLDSNPFDILNARETIKILKELSYEDAYHNKVTLTYSKELRDYQEAIYQSIIKCISSKYRIPISNFSDKFPIELEQLLDTNFEEQSTRRLRPNPFY